MFIASVII